MKRLFCIILSACLILCLSACGEPPTVQTDFAAVFTAQNGGAEYAGTADMTGGCLTVTMTEPYTVQGVTFAYADGTLTIRRGGLSAEADADYLPGGPADALYGVLPYLSQAEYTGTQNGTDAFTVPTPRGAVSLSAVDGFPTALTDPNSGYTFTFEAVEGCGDL